MEEIWKDILGYEGMYQVSNTGQVRSLDREISQLNRWGSYSHKTLKGRILSSSSDDDGYTTVALSKGGQTKYCLVHRLVAQAFLPNPDNLPQVNHKDEHPCNNNVNNLEWCTSEYNMTYGTRLQRISAANKGKPFPKELAAAMSESRKGSGNPMYGKHHSEEAKKKISEALKGKKHSPEAIDNVRKALLGKPTWNKGLQTTPITCLDENIEFEGSRSAGEWAGVTSSAIIYACSHVSCCKGHVFVYSKNIPEDVAQYVYECYKHSGRYKDLEMKWLDKCQNNT